jgi:hypothetical protein
LTQTDCLLQSQHSREQHEGRANDGDAGEEVEEAVVPQVLRQEAGTARQYSISAIAHETRIAFQSGQS